MAQPRFKEGDLVYLRKEISNGDSGRATIMRMLTDIPGGVRLDRCLDYFSYWNVQDLKRDHRRKRKLASK